MPNRPFLRPCSVLTLAACPSCSHWTTGDRRADDVDYRCAYSMSTVTACPLPSARTLCGEGEQKQRGSGPCTADPRSGRAGTLYRRRLGIPPATGGKARLVGPRASFAGGKRDGPGVHLAPASRSAVHNRGNFWLPRPTRSLEHWSRGRPSAPLSRRAVTLGPLLPSWYQQQRECGDAAGGIVGAGAVCQPPTAAGLWEGGAMPGVTARSHVSVRQNLLETHA